MGDTFAAAVVEKYSRKGFVDQDPQSISSLEFENKAMDCETKL